MIGGQSIILTTLTNILFSGSVHAAHNSCPVVIGLGTGELGPKPTPQRSVWCRWNPGLHRSAHAFLPDNSWNDRIDRAGVTPPTSGECPVQTKRTQAAPSVAPLKREIPAKPIRDSRRGSKRNRPCVPSRYDPPSPLRRARDAGPARHLAPKNDPSANFYATATTVSRIILVKGAKNYRLRALGQPGGP